MPGIRGIAGKYMRSGEDAKINKTQQSARWKAALGTMAEIY